MGPVGGSIMWSLALFVALTFSSTHPVLTSQAEVPTEEDYDFESLDYMSVNETVAISKNGTEVELPWADAI